MAQRSSRTEIDWAEERMHGNILNASGTGQAQYPHNEMLATHMTAEDHDIQPFWLGRQRVYAEFSSPEDEDDVYESGCFWRKSPSIKILIFDHATKKLEISSGLDKVNSKSIFLQCLKPTINAALI